MNDGTGRPGITLAIVGAGAYCTYALERLAANYAALRAPPLTVIVFERGDRFGSGMAQAAAQPATSATNRVASQIGFAADESNVRVQALLPKAARPTFCEWLQERHEATGDSRYLLRPNDIVGRALHGEALEDVFRRYKTVLEAAGATVELRGAEVAICGEAGDGRLELADASRRPLALADAVLLVTGHPDNRIAPGTQAERWARHAERDRRACYLHQPYPLDRRVTADVVPPGAAVGLLGMGLTALDVILYLTEGRGGRFEPHPRLGSPFLIYRASGAEPAAIVPVSPSGLFACCRADNQKALDPDGAKHRALEHKAVFFSEASIRSLRRHVGVPPRAGGPRLPQLDFGRHLFPLLVLEMALVWYATQLDRGVMAGFHRAVEERFLAFLKQPMDDRDAGIAFLLAPVEQWADSLTAGGSASRLKRFDWRALFDPLIGEPERWGERLTDFLRQDLAAAARGNLTDPGKACADAVWRDLRPVLGAALDRGGLTARSQREWRSYYSRYYCRMSNGPGMPSQAKLIALLEHGLVDPTVGPAPRVDPVDGGFRILGGRTGVTRQVAALIAARMHDFDIDADLSPLYRDLREAGLVRLWVNPGGEDSFVPGCLDLDEEFRPIRRDGRPEQRLTVLGAPAEGLVHFHLSAARAGAGSGIFDVLDRWALRTLGRPRADEESYVAERG